MNKFKYLLLLSILFSSVKATEQELHTVEEEQQEQTHIEELSKKTNTQEYQEPDFEEFVKKTKADDINRISIVIDIDKNKKYPETWQLIFNSFVECARNIQDLENQNFGKLTEFLSTIYENINNIHGNIGIKALTKPEN